MPRGRTKRGKPDFRKAPTTEQVRELESFSYKGSDGLRVSFSATHVDDPDRTKGWNATVSRSSGGRSKSVCVYAGTDNTLAERWSKTLSKVRRKFDSLD